MALPLEGNMAGSGTFNDQILVDKLAKLNNTQQSIETLSHWCIFHRKRARHVVETWERQFHCSPRGQRVPYLYLANDILQNSRRKGAEFVAEFWKVLPTALGDVYENGGEFGRNTVLRLVDIWEDRKVFGSHGQLLKEELLGMNVQNRSRDGRSTSYKLRRPGGDMLQKLVDSYEHIYGGPFDEDAALGKCQNALAFIENAEKKVGDDSDRGKGTNSKVLEELQAQHGVLKECIEQLKAVESSRTSLASLLREALCEQEMKLERVHSQLQVALSRYEHVGNICQQLTMNQSPHGERLKETSVILKLPHSSVSETQPIKEDTEASTPAGNISQQASSFADNLPDTNNEDRKSAAAEVAAKLTASTSSAQMLSFVLSSLASEGVITEMAKEDYPSDVKRPKIENGTTLYIPFEPQPHPPAFSHPDSIPQLPPPPSPSSILQPMTSLQPPALIPLMPPLQPPATQFGQVSGSMPSMQFSFSPTPLNGTPIPGFPVGIPPFPGPASPYQNFPTTPPSTISRQ